MDERYLEIHVENSPTILSKIMQVIKRRRINIIRLLAVVKAEDPEQAKIEMVVDADEEKSRLIKTQIEKLVDVIEIK